MKVDGRASRHAERKLAVQVLYSLTFANPGKMVDIRKAYESSPARMPCDESGAPLAQGEMPAQEEAACSWQLVMPCDESGAPLTPEQIPPQEEDAAYSWRLVQGVWSNLAGLDESIDSFSTNWRRDRIGRVELAILRIALYELLMEKMEARVVISEARALCREFDVEGAIQLIHGIVDAAARGQRNWQAENTADRRHE